MLPENETIELIKSILSRDAINDVQIRAEIISKLLLLFGFLLFKLGHLPKPTYAVRIHVVKLMPSAFLNRTILNTCVNRPIELSAGHAIYFYAE